MQAPAVTATEDRNDISAQVYRHTCIGTYGSRDGRCIEIQRDILGFENIRNPLQRYKLLNRIYLYIDLAHKRKRSERTVLRTDQDCQAHIQSLA